MRWSTPGPRPAYASLTSHGRYRPAISAHTIASAIATMTAVRDTPKSRSRLWDTRVSSSSPSARASSRRAARREDVLDHVVLLLVRHLRIKREDDAPVLRPLRVRQRHLARGGAEVSLAVRAHDA